MSYLSLDAALERFDGKQTGFLDRVAADWPANEALILHLVAFAEQADAIPQAAATGLLKRHLTTSTPFPASATNRLLDLLPRLETWEARLHVLQMLPSFVIPDERAAALYDFLQKCLATERNRFVRAWTYSGLHHLAAFHAGYCTAVRALLKQAMRDEPASIRARLRHLPTLGKSTRKRSGADPDV